MTLAASVFAALSSLLATTGCPAFGFVGDGTPNDAGAGPDDGGSSDDAGPTDDDAGTLPQAFTCVGAACPATPRPLAPLSGRRVTSASPALRFVQSPGETSARVELCRDRAFTDACASFTAEDGAGQPAAPLAPGLWFWRVVEGFGTDEAVRSATWSFAVGPRDSDRDTTLGLLDDFDGDGFADFAVGTDRDDGWVHVFHGGSDELAPAYLLPAPEGHQFGPESLVNAGDVNGDGYADLAAGAGGFPTGEAFVYHGGPEGLPLAPSSTLIGVGSYGRGIEAAGDVNGDGFADLLIGDPIPDQLIWHLFFGSLDGIVQESDSQVLDGPESPYDFVVDAAAGLGDVDGDGFGDVALQVDGETQVFYGSPGGLLPQPTIVPTEVYANLVPAGDVDGDGHADLLQRVAISGELGSESAEVYLHLGGADGIRTTPTRAWREDWLFGIELAGEGDVDGDGLADFAVSGHEQMNVFVFGHGPDGPGDRIIADVTGAFDDLALRDEDGDGFSDLVVRAYPALLELHRTADGAPGAKTTWTPDGDELIGPLTR